LTPSIGLTLALVVAAVALFASGRLREDVIALLVLLALIASGLLSSEQAFLGFASPAVITIWAVFILSGGLVHTGIADRMGDLLLRLAGRSEGRLIVVVMLGCGLMSAFMNNIGATAVLLPAVVAVARRARVPPSRLLIPLSFSSLLGGNLTMVGTPPNILAASILAERGLPPPAFFDFAPTGVLVLAIGVAYMATIGRRLLPSNEPAVERQLRRLREYVSELRVSQASPLAGKPLYASRLSADFDLTVLGVERGGGRMLPLPDVVIQSGDVLIVEGAPDDWIPAQEQLGLELASDRKIAIEDLDENGIQLVEVALAPGSGMIGRTLREGRFRELYGYLVVAISRQGEVLTRRLGDLRLRLGDALLLRGPKDRLEWLHERGEFLILGPVEIESRRRGRAGTALAVVIGVIAIIGLAAVPVAVAMLVGALAMVLSGCLSMQEAYRSIDWRSVFLVAGMLPLGMAMEVTGTASFLADRILGVVGGLGPLAMLAGIYLLASLITEPMSNAAATVVIVPIAIDLALGIGANPWSFVLATVIAASTSFLTPVGHQVNVLVLEPGGYRFADFARVGAPLNLLILAATVLAVPIIWPLFG
jgi:di/tricarboxylate transporter